MFPRLNAPLCSLSKEIPPLPLLSRNDPRTPVTAILVPPLLTMLTRTAPVPVTLFPTIRQ